MVLPRTELGGKKAGGEEGGRGVLLRTELGFAGDTNEEVMGRHFNPAC